MNNNELVEISIKLTKEELKVIREVAERFSMSEADCIRIILFHKDSKIVKDPIVKQSIRDMAKIAETFRHMKLGIYGGDLNKELQSLEDSINSLKSF